MPVTRRTHADGACILFTPTRKIRVRALDRAIAGGVRSGSLGAATAEDYEEVGAEVRLALSEHAAARRALRGRLSSLAYSIAYNKTRDRYRRTPADALHRRQEGEAAELCYDLAPCPAETGEARLIRRDTARHRALRLRAAIRQLSPADRAALLGMLERDAPLPRLTPEDRRRANAIAQAEKRARDRLFRALREGAR